MSKITKTIVERYRLILIIALIMSVICISVINKVSINYRLADYLPPEARSTQAIKLLNAEFGSGIPNVDFYKPNLNLSQAMELKREIKKVSGVEAVYWLDDQWDLNQPLELADKDILDNFYKDGGARFIIIAGTDNSVQTVKELRGLAGDTGYLAGDLINLAAAQQSSTDEIIQITYLIVPAATFFLILATTSYLEPLLLVLCILFGVLLNMGSNVFLGEISFLTNSVAPILQMAVSMDYAIFLLHRYHDYKAQGLEPKVALQAAIQKASVSVLSSSLTTLFGFLALLFMRFGIGADMGLVLAKGIVFSLLSVIILLPALIVLTDKWFKKFEHRDFMPNFKWLGQLAFKIKVPCLVIVICLALPAYLAQSHLNFRYNMDGLKSGSRDATDRLLITEKFGAYQQMALMVPKNDPEKAVELETKLKRIPEMVSIISYNNQVGNQVPVDFLPDDKIKTLISPNYSRMILTLDIAQETSHSFAVVQKIREMAADVYHGKAFLAGETPTMLDMKNTVTSDTLIVNGLAILAIGLVLLLAFRSFSIPLMLLLTIEASIWINLSIPYFTDTRLAFIGYLVISTVQLGATVDYGILFVQYYIDYRQSSNKKDAVISTVTSTAKSLLPPAIILMAAGIFLSIVSSLDVVRELGKVLARGAALSLANVLLFLPAFLYYTDKVALGCFFGKLRRKQSKHTDISMNL